MDQNNNSRWFMTERPMLVTYVNFIDENDKNQILSTKITVH